MREAVKPVCRKGSALTLGSGSIVREPISCSDTEQILFVVNTDTPRLLLPNGLADICVGSDALPRGRLGIRLLTMCTLQTGMAAITARVTQVLLPS